MAPSELNLATWNVQGLYSPNGSPNRKWIVRTWLKQVKISISILALQEIKANSFRLDEALCTILPNFQHLSFAPDNGKGGIALLIHLDLFIKTFVSLELGRAVWAQLEKDGEHFGVVSIYGLDSARKRAQLWHELKLALPRDN
ncbi:unnamed protein product [Calypogeia fissa]